MFTCKPYLVYYKKLHFQPLFEFLSVSMHLNATSGNLILKF